ncbi:unnamed protein product [Clonostachys rosea]|uniref:Xylanolytic transcriptional activator regulatory domain-containing protein n=1 Tax=Bionectria ochroleuca TaxID=29856 RepID=A0ABY6U387_BIOOC|nr:unnamed protein product [Clonostachys rosea]
MGIALEEEPDHPEGASLDDAAQDAAVGQQNPGPDPAVVALLESLKGTNTSVQVLTTDGCSLPVMDATVAQSSLIFIPDKEEKQTVLDFTKVRLACPIEIEQIQNRWLSQTFPIPKDAVLNYPQNIKALLHRILKSYAGTAIRGRGVLPFIHPLRITDPRLSERLSTCLLLVRVLDNPILGPDQSTPDIIKRKMSDIQDQYRGYYNMDAVEAFQAYLIYTLALFFYVNDYSRDYLAVAMLNLQGLARHVTLQGLVVRKKAPNCRPIWEDWVLAETKRRTILVMYMFDTLLASMHNLPTYLVAELQGLPAPGPKSLWQARVRSHWRSAHDTCIVHWDKNSFLRIVELWPPTPDLTGHEIQLRQNRVDLWLEDVDEFGLVFYTFMASTHGS